jgi:hypothetical protein
MPNRALRYPAFGCASSLSRNSSQKAALFAPFSFFPDKRELNIRTALESDRLPNPDLSVARGRAEGESGRLTL